MQQRRLERPPPVPKPEPLLIVDNNTPKWQAKKDAQAAKKKATARTIQVQEGIRADALAQRLKVKLKDLLETAESLGLQGVDGLAGDSPLSAESAEFIVLEMDQIPEVLPGHIRDVSPRLTDAKLLLPRSPVVTIMGHVDHGKTTLLDAFRDSSIVDGEAGGITQHIGAFVVDVDKQTTITFLDTPGHAAFSAMRERGALATDIVILVVAADDGVMPQTTESIKFAKSAEVPVVVAINKCDKENIDLDRIKNELMEAGLDLEDNGGDVQCVAVSALEKLNLSELLEAVTIAAEMADLQAEVVGPVEGIIIEAKTVKGKGPIATILVRRGTLKAGVHVVAGVSSCKVRALSSGERKVVKKAGPSEPVELSGWNGIPMVGDLVLEVENDQRAREVVDFRSNIEDASKMQGAKKTIRSSKRDARTSRIMENQKTKAVLEARRVRRREARHALREALVQEANETLSINEREVNILLKTDVVGCVLFALDHADRLLR